MSSFIEGDETSATSRGVGPPLSASRSACCTARKETSRLESALSPPPSGCSQTRLEYEEGSNLRSEAALVGSPLTWLRRQLERRSAWKSCGFSSDTSVMREPMGQISSICSMKSGVRSFQLSNSTLCSPNSCAAAPSPPSTAPAAPAASVGAAAADGAAALGLRRSLRALGSASFSSAASRTSESSASRTSASSGDSSSCASSPPDWRSTPSGVALA
mmetsp:Transcript_7524/g.19571  ORF Transcript_7524/g.19571 Transcript_7524/m.19571 type:complete len:217 (+) Transcript_7524:691-1341(+)